MNRADNLASDVGDATQSRSPIAVLDESGIIVSTNGAWREQAGEFLGKQCGIGTNYLAYCESGDHRGRNVGQAISAGIRQVMAQHEEEWSLPYRYPEDTDSVWGQVHVMRIEESDPVAIVVTHHAFDKHTEALQPLSTLPTSEADRVRSVLRHTTDLVSNASNALFTQLNEIAQSLRRIREDQTASEEQKRGWLEHALLSSQVSLPVVRDLLEVSMALSREGHVQRAPSDEILHLVHWMAHQSAPHSRRRERRYPVAISVVATPVDEKLRPVDDAFEAITRDISNRGISLIHTRRVEEKYLSVEFQDLQGRKMNAVLEVLRCRPVGSHFEVAGSFVWKQPGIPKASSRAAPNAPAAKM